jgi:hypothetical protein
LRPIFITTAKAQNRRGFVAEGTVGDVTLLAFGLLGLLGLILIAAGTLCSSRLLVVLGGGLLLGLAGAWIAGLPAAAIGLIPLAFLRQRWVASRSERG